MARRSRKTLQAEGQLSLFAMTDDFLFAVTENTENAVDKAAESRSYVNQIAGEPPADASRKGDEDGRPEATVYGSTRHEVPVHAGQPAGEGSRAEGIRGDGIVSRADRDGVPQPDQRAHAGLHEVFASQRHTVLTAFYTPAPVIGAIYDALREAGIGRGDNPAAILEPGCGTGNFMRLAPADLALDFHGVELDPISARIAQALCPKAHITAAGLEECRVSPASFDAAIGNVPYSGDIKIDGMPIHDYFIRKSIESVRPGGIVAVLTSRYTLDKNSTATRRAMAEKAELLGAVRLPAETFRRQAGTEALSDILLLRRRPEPIALSDDELPEWVETSPFEDTVNINRYFNEHPGRAIGDMSTLGVPGDIAEAARCSAAASAHDGHAEGEKRKAGM